MLVPKRVKHRREFRGKMRGEAKGGKTIAFGSLYFVGDIRKLFQLSV